MPKQSKPRTTPPAEDEDSGAHVALPGTLRSATIGSLIRYAHRALVRALAQDLAEWDVSTAQWSALRVLWEEDGYSQVELANSLRVDKAALTSVLDALERKEFIARVRHKEDRRRVLVFLTPKGRELSRQLAPSALAVNSMAVVGIKEADQAILRESLLKIIGNCEQSKAD